MEGRPITLKLAREVSAQPLLVSADLDLMEINEAFVAQAIAVNKVIGWDTSRINVNGGAIAIRHRSAPPGQESWSR